jgi:hypothetical protein
MGTWRSNKVHYPVKQWRFIGEDQNWTQIEIKPGGKMDVWHHFAGVLQGSSYPYSWKQEKDRLIIMQLGWVNEVVELSAEAMVIKSEATDTTWYYRKVVDPASDRYSEGLQQKSE